MVDTRTVTLPAIWADDAITEIPTPPIANTTYRNTDLGSTELLQGWPYQKIVDSADFNQTLWLISNLVKNCEQYGIMPWCASTTYKQNGICLASNGIFYWAKKDNTGVNPVTDSGMTNWGVFLDPGDNFVTETVLTSQTNLCEKLANKTQTLSSSSTSTQYPSAKAVYDNINNLQTSLQSAISAIQANYVTTNTAQNITGKKIFTNNVNPVVLKKSGDNTLTEIQLQDKNGIRQGGIRSIADSSQEQLTLYAASADGNSIIGSIGIAKDSNNGVKTLCPAPAASTDTSNVAIMTVGRAADPSQNFNLLHRSGDETFSGVKTVQSNNPRFGLKHTEIDVTTNPSAEKSTRIFVSDKNNKWISEIGFYQKTDGNIVSQITANNDTAGVATLQIVCNKDGSRYATCPTPPSADDNSTKISNTQWVNSRISSIMNSKQLPELTQLYLNTSGLPTGNVQLSQPFTNFPYVLIGLSDDDFTVITYQMFNSAILDWFLKGNPVDKGFLFAGGPNHWKIKNYAHGSSTTLWLQDYENSRFVCVYGVSF